ncbi:DUF2142 domain-containing protein [Collinsella intestinalis]|uniref:DUF2142 domain-containing protein n=1 Tax=Collinsella intestinalis TaxID=147207 RepID=UPI0019570742|nr:DUF2142 domain-containing protein [Collinsella intestinalis]
MNKLVALGGTEKNGLVFASVTLACLLLCALVYWTIVSHNKLFLVLFGLVCLICTLLAGFCLFRCHNEKCSRFLHDYSERYHFVALVLFGILFVFAFPPGSVPDEPHHFWSSYTLADVMTGHEVDYDKAEIEMRAIDAEVNFNALKDINKQSFRMIVDEFEPFNSSSEWKMLPVPREAMNFGSNPVYIKLPSALSIVIGIVLDLGFYPMFYLGRLLNYVIFIVCIVVSVRITPIAKNGFRAISLLPITLHLCASYSYDVGIICLSFLLTACLFRLLLDEEITSRSFGRYAALSSVLAVLLAPCKVIYLAIFLLIFLVPNHKFPSTRNAYIVKFGVVIVSLLFILTMRGASISSLAAASDGANGLDHRGVETGVFYSLSDIIRDPFGTLILFARTMDQLGDYYLQTLVGGSLGWLQENIRLPMHYVFAYLIILYLSFMKSRGDEKDVGYVIRLSALVIAIAIWIGAMVSMYLGWTFNTEQLILGVQGRYLLPALPLLFIGLRSNRIIRQGDTFNLMLVGMCSLNSLSLMRTFAMALAA